MDIDAFGHQLRQLTARVELLSARVADLEQLAVNREAPDEPAAPSEETELVSEDEVVSEEEVTEEVADEPEDQEEEKPSKKRKK